MGDNRSDYEKLTHDPCPGCEHCRPERCDGCDSILPDCICEKLKVALARSREQQDAIEGWQSLSEVNKQQVFESFETFMPLDQWKKAIRVLRVFAICELRRITKEGR